jgi:F-type H+-transporting ATPase subunit b
MTVRAVLRLLLVVLAVGAAPAAPARAQEHAAAQPPTSATTEHAGAPAEEHSDGLLPTIARLFNFAVLAGVLVYFLRTPIGEYLSTRGGQIRQELVTAAELRRTATGQLEEIDRRLAALPAELDALKARGAEDIAAEEVRIAEVAKAERERLLVQTRREIDMRLRIARRELTEHAAQLAVSVAEARIVRTITSDDQLRLLDRYAAQLAEQGPGGGTSGHGQPDKEAR